MIGIRIAELRRLRGMNQAQLAERLSTSASTIGMYEQGRRLPNIYMVVKIAEVFCVTTDYLLMGTQDKS